MKIDGRTLDHKTFGKSAHHGGPPCDEEREAPSEVMKSMGLCRTSIYRWLRDHARAGMEALVEKMAAGREPSSRKSSANRSNAGSWARIPGNMVLIMVVDPGDRAKLDPAEVWPDHWVDGGRAVARRFGHYAAEAVAAGL